MLKRWLLLNYPFFQTAVLHSVDQQICPFIQSFTKMSGVPPRSIPQPLTKFYQDLPGTTCSTAAKNDSRAGLQHWWPRSQLQPLNDIRGALSWAAVGGRLGCVPAGLNPVTHAIPPSTRYMWVADAEWRCLRFGSEMQKKKHSVWICQKFKLKSNVLHVQTAGKAQMSIFVSSVTVNVTTKIPSSWMNCECFTSSS